MEADTELKNNFYFSLRERFPHAIDPFNEIATWALTDFIFEYIQNRQQSQLQELILSLQMEINPESDPDFQLGIRTAQDLLKSKLIK